MNTVKDALGFTQGLLGDPDGEWATRQYILPFMNVCYNSISLQIKNATSRNLELIVELVDIEPGTVTLAPLQKPGKALAGLYDPLQLWWKPAGQNWNCYTPAYPKETLPFFGPTGNPTNTPAGGLFFNWRASTLNVAPMGQSVDILVDGRFNVTPLVNDEDVLVLMPNLATTLALATSALSGVERTNPTVLEGYAAQAAADVDNIVADLTRQKQGYSKRLGRQAPNSCGLLWW